MSCAGEHDPFPKIAAAVTVRSNRMIAPGVYELVAERGVAGADLAGSRASLVPESVIPAPAPGQFFMLRARPSGVLLGRPISVYVSDNSTITFLILKKGRGTVELCELRAGDLLDIVGPIGNRFLTPAELRAGENATSVGSSSADSAVAGGAFAALPERPRVAVIGGGIGVAPVAGFSLALPEKSFDFYASFRSAPYGLDLVSPRAAKLVVTTEDGSAGVKGMLPAVFDPANYDLVYACGPTPMLRYIKDVCGDNAGRGPLAFVSLEEHMACGAGACLGCTVRTVSGNRRCCVDGPVFNAAEVML